MTALNTLSLQAHPHTTAPTLLVLLAGAYDKPADFIAAGFDTALRACGRDLDLVLVESDLAAVCDGTLASRLEDEIFAPARRAGYRSIFSGGISIGALSALMHLDLHPASSAGLVLIAPYPGNRSITGEIAAAGGLATWSGERDFAANDERRGWRALQRAARAQRPPVWLGYGRKDRFGGGHAQMAAVLPPSAVHVEDGAHDWPTWLQLWRAFLAHER